MRIDELHFNKNLAMKIDDKLLGVKLEISIIFESWASNFHFK